MATCFSQELLRWVDISDAKYVTLTARRELRAKRPALALKAVQKAIGGEDQAGKDLWELREKLVVAELGWGHLKPALAAAQKAHFPPQQAAIF